MKERLGNDKKEMSRSSSGDEGRRIRDQTIKRRRGEELEELEEERKQKGGSSKKEERATKT